MGRVFIFSAFKMKKPQCPMGGPAGVNYRLELANAKKQEIPHMYHIYADCYSTEDGTVYYQATEEDAYSNLMNYLILLQEVFQFTPEDIMIFHDVQTAWFVSVMSSIKVNPTRTMLVYHAQGPLYAEYLEFFPPEQEMEEFLNEMTEKAMDWVGRVGFPSIGAYELLIEQEPALEPILANKKVEILYNGCDCQYDPNKAYFLTPIADRLQQEGVDYTFLSVANLVSAKGLDRLPAFFVQCRERNLSFRWIILGSGPDEEKIRREVEKYDLTEYVIPIRERVANEDVLYLMRQVTFYIMAHRKSIFDFATIEAMHMGAVPILSAVGGNKEILQEGNGFLLAEDMRESGEQFCQWIEQQDLKLLQKRNQEIAEAAYSESGFLIRYANVIEQMEMQDTRRNALRILSPRDELVAHDDIPWALQEMGYEVIRPEGEIEISKYRESDAKYIEEVLEKEKIDLVITHDFGCCIAEACHRKNIPYIAWAFDAPLQALYSEQAKYKTNYIFSFDRVMMDQVSQMEIPHLFFMPLGANCSRVSGLIVEPEDEEKYSCEISMVGSLYDNNHATRLLQECSIEAKSDMQAWMDKNVCIWDGQNHIHDYLKEETLSELQERACTDAEECFHMPNRLFYEAIVAEHMTYRERVMVLKQLASKYAVRLYTGSNVSELQDVECMGKSHYDLETPKIFHLSRINLNITLRRIESGIPQRIFDIMSVGGFVMTNYQPGLEELFELDKDLVAFYNLEDLMEKVEYYLTHERERIRIAMNGYQKVIEKYNYPNLLEKMIEKTFRDRKS